MAALLLLTAAAPAAAQEEEGALGPDALGNFQNFKSIYS